jgi:poly-beta-1,6 N-acetyl-D-glucosamine synthase
MQSARSTDHRVSEHWFALATAAVALVVALGLQGYARDGIGRASTISQDRSAAAQAMAGAGPIIDLSGPAPRTISVPAKTVALTFDDGPDPRWTPKVLDVLAREGVPATFFVIGSHVTSYPGIVAREDHEGHEIGNHTFTHVSLLQTSTWRAGLELRLTEVAIAAATGHHTLLMRPPYSSEPDAVRADTLQSWQRDIGGRYLVVLASRVSGDWEKNKPVDAIVADSLPSGTDGAIIVMHDGGGNRTRTVAALGSVIHDLKGRGYRFVSVSQLAHLSRAVVMPPVTTSVRLRSEALPWTLRISSWAANSFTIFAVLAAVLAVLRSIVLALFARRHAGSVPTFDPTYTPSVTIVVPAFNEETGIESSVVSLARQVYPDFEVIVVDDGSTDGTAKVVDDVVARDGFENVSVVRQANAGKAGALNAGLARASGEIIVTVDADTVFAPNALALLVQKFRDDRVGAVSGNTKVMNRKRLLGRWQHVEYVMGFNLDRRMYDLLGCMPTVPGAIGAFRATALRGIGGFSDDTLAEDADVTMALHRAGWSVAYEPRAIAWTEAPSRVRDLWRQRYRWSYGTTQSIWKHRHAVVERGPAGRLGRIGIPYLLFFQVALPLLGPAVDIFTLYGVLFLDARFLIVYWLAFTALQVATAAYALHLDDEPMGPLWTVPLQQFAYRQLMYLVVLQSVATALSGARLRWHNVRRMGAARA